MPDLKTLIGYIEKRQVKEERIIGYSFVRDLPANIRDTFFAMACLKMLDADSPDEEIVNFLSNYEQFDLNGAYYAMKCLILAGAQVDFKEGSLHWIYQGDRQQRPFSIPTTPLINYFRYELYGMYGSSIFSSTLGAVLKRIELGANSIDSRLLKMTLDLLDTDNHQDIMSIFMALEILHAMEKRSYRISISSYHIQHISDFLKRCKTRKGYVGNPTASSVSLESTYAGHRIAQYIRVPDPLGIRSFIDSLQNENGGFRGSQFGGISTLESCYLALSIFFDISNEDHGSHQRRSG